MFIFRFKGILVDQSTKSKASQLCSAWFCKGNECAPEHDTRDAYDGKNHNEEKDFDVVKDIGDVEKAQNEEYCSGNATSDLYRFQFVIVLGAHRRARGIFQNEKTGHWHKLKTVQNVSILKQIYFVVTYQNKQTQKPVIVEMFWTWHFDF